MPARSPSMGTSDADGAPPDITADVLVPSPLSPPTAIQTNVC